MVVCRLIGEDFLTCALVRDSAAVRVISALMMTEVNLFYVLVYNKHELKCELTGSRLSTISLVVNTFVELIKNLFARRIKYIVTERIYKYKYYKECLNVWVDSCT